MYIIIDYILNNKCRINDIVLHYLSKSHLRQYYKVDFSCDPESATIIIALNYCYTHIM